MFVLRGALTALSRTFGDNVVAPMAVGKTYRLLSAKATGSRLRLTSALAEEAPDAPL